VVGACECGNEPQEGLCSMELSYIKVSITSTATFRTATVFGVTGREFTNICLGKTLNVSTLILIFQYNLHINMIVFNYIAIEYGEISPCCKFASAVIPSPQQYELAATC
jgi:hypothetical protein